MSSAAVQSSAAAAAAAAAALPTSRSYQQSSQQYYQQQSPNSAAPSNTNTNTSSTTTTSQSRKQRSASGNNGASPLTPQQASHFSSSEVSASGTTPRPQQQQQSQLSNASPLPSNGASSTFSSSSRPPISPPQRTSSQQQRAATATADPELDQQMDNLAIDAQSRRRTHASPRESQRSSGKAKASPSHSRSQNAIGEPPIGTDLPREQSNIIKRIVASDPQEDVVREQERMQEAHGIAPSGLGLVGSEGVNDAARAQAVAAASASQSKPRDGKARKEMKFGDYVLGQTLGEGEFGKVKMGWKRDGGVQVAIKLIRKESLDKAPTRLPKIYREITILRNLQHPNIVRLHEMVETQRHIGIILEYASGGELFDYILTHRYLKDQAARRLFAQLVSGVGYLHKRGIVHRDLKLENLLLDRNRNIIITDFGFANTFNPKDELGEEMEYRLGDKDFIRASGLDKQDQEGHRRGDLMQTSCGSPCYAAPELVVSDTLYTGRKVDVWSCGVILYAMLAGYLPFDDDPANPEGDNINLLYKYIVSTPLTFPEYVTPHARDLLKRILVPDPRKRADLFEVARHSWLSEYYHVVEFITSSTTDPSEVQNAPQSMNEAEAGPKLGRSASVREPSKSHMPAAYNNAQKPQPQDTAPTPDKANARDTKRRTVQVEYIAPQQATTRGDAAVDPQNVASAARSRARAENQGPIEVPATTTTSSTQRASLPQRPVQASMPPPTRPTRDNQRAISDSTAFTSPWTQPAVTNVSRPTTGGSMTAGNRLPSRGNSYGQPSAATVAATNAAGQFSQPQGKSYTISTPMQQTANQDIDANEYGRMSTQQPSVKHQDGRDSRYNTQGRGHKRSSTLGGLIDRTLGRSGSIRGGRPSNVDQGPSEEKLKKSYPPTSMRKGAANEDNRRNSSDSRRSFSFGRKNTSDSTATGMTNKQEQRSSRRFSLLNAFRMKSHDDGGAAPPQAYAQDASTPPPQNPQSGYRNTTQQRPGMAFGQGESRPTSMATSDTDSTIPGIYDSALDRRRGVPQQQAPQQQQQQQRTATHMPQQQSQSTPNMQLPPTAQHDNDQYYRGTPASAQNPYDKPLPFTPQYPSGFDPDEDDDVHGDRRGGAGGVGAGGNKLQKSHRQFSDAYDDKDHSGSSSAARKVADFFRRRGKNRDSTF